jgi:hypothetical protein
VKRNLVAILVLAALMAALLSACGSQAVVTVEPSVMSEVTAYADPMADAILTGMQKVDYTAFSQYFDTAMLKAMDDASMKKLVDQLSGQVGAIKSRLAADSVEEVVSNGVKYYAVMYPVSFDKTDAVHMRMVVTAEEPHQVSGLFFK